MSLRTRLVLTVLSLLVLGCGVALGATAGALQDWQTDRNDDVLTSVGRQLGTELAARPEPRLRLRDAGAEDDVWRTWSTLASQDGEVPSFFQLRSADGMVLQTVVYGSAPDLPEPLPKAYWPVEATAENPDGEAFGEAETMRSDGSADDPGWLIRSSRVGDGGEQLIVGMRTQATDELMSRVASAATVSGLVALIAVALLSLSVVRRGLRPLNDIAEVAREIGSGDLTRRVPPSRPSTEIGRLSAALNAMLGQIERAFAERAASEQQLRRFVADASHELRTPIATIRGHAELFRRGAAARPDDLAKILRRIESEAHRMGLLVDELLLLARLDQGRPLEREPVDLTDLASDAVADAVVTDPGRSIRLDAPDTGAGQEPVVVQGDPHRLRQVLGNLLSNVIQHTPPDTPAVVRVRRDAGDAVIEVSDSGPGLPEEERQHIFERFYRTEESRVRHHGGAGLGLSIVAAVTQAHGGTVTAENNADGGATFRVRLPLT
ncbi:sensor histidine kinase [Microlunatus parietis]|uniref:histidine kinase n=1 Tax=Microlunatus parietis TaxID=682979 RepID=A0A7Y9IA54_9ACTN|nr:HAMP domain-containing sensor histidine kinase [Microlunatus parietis]NYE73128.1 two-component system OmpR family sensor kinase [Microlunatus parietis]